MSVGSVQRILALLFLIGLSQAGLVHRRNAKENAPATNLDAELRKDQIPVTILLESDDSVRPVETSNLKTEAPIAAVELPAATPAEVEQIKQQLLKKQPAEKDVIESSTPNAEPELQLLTTEGVVLAPIDNAQQQQQQKDDTDIVVKVEQAEIAPQTEGIVESSTILAAPIADEASPVQQSLATENIQPEAAASNLVPAITAPLPVGNDIKALPQVVASEIAAQEVALADGADDLERQATQATPTQTSTPQNFVQQFIQNSPIGQFLSQFTGGQQQQQQQQQQQEQQADQPATPQPTIPGFLNPANAITSAQQAVQNAAQTVVNSTTQAFQGLQQFATNLGTQFQNTFSTLAGQQNQLTTADSTTTRPLGPIQQIVSNFIGGNNATAAGAGQQPGPLQGILGFFQAGNRPQAATTPPKEVEPPKPSVDDKIETQAQNDAIVEQPAEEPESANEVRTSAEVNSEDTSFEVGPAEDLIIVNDDAAQQDVSV